MILFLYLLILKEKISDGITHSFQRFLKKDDEDGYKSASETASLSI